MGHRYEISDADWGRVKGHLPGRRGQHGGVAKDNRRSVNAVLWVARTGAAWADLPDRLGNWDSQWRRFDRWAAKGRWDPIRAALRDPDLDILVLDSTVARAQPGAAGAKRNGTAPAARRTRNSAGAGAGSGRRFLGVSTASATRPSCS